MATLAWRGAKRTYEISAKGGERTLLARLNQFDPNVASDRFGLIVQDHATPSSVLTADAASSVGLKETHGMVSPVPRLLIASFFGLVFCLGASIVLHKQLEVVWVVLQSMVVFYHATSVWDDRFLLSGSRRGWAFRLTGLYVVIFVIGYFVIKTGAGPLYQLIAA